MNHPSSAQPTAVGLSSLHEAPDNQSVVITRIDCASQSLRLRLMELGMNVETVIRKRKAAGGTICNVGHSRFALGRRVCLQIRAALAP